jgi:tRNA-splicing ligase RtcB
MSWLRSDELLGKEYWSAHNSAANYAIVNRLIISRAVSDATEAVFGSPCEVYYDISHNLVQEETIDAATDRKGFVHRKGATRALPTGHPDIGCTGWEGIGHPVLVPGSMLTGAAILRPLEGAARSGFSVNHGSGRLMARGHAKKTLEKLQGEIDREMNEIVRIFGPDGVQVVGVLENSRETPLDECGRVYKDLDSVLDVLQNEGIAEVERRLYPVANVKGID